MRRSNPSWTSFPRRSATWRSTRPGQKDLVQRRFSIDGAKFRLVRALLTYQREAKRKGEPAPYFWTAELAEHLEVDDNALRTEPFPGFEENLEAKLATDQGIVFSERLHREREGEGLNPDLAPDIREVSLADMERPMSQSKLTNVTRGAVTKPLLGLSEGRLLSTTGTEAQP